MDYGKHTLFRDSGHAVTMPPMHTPLSAQRIAAAYGSSSPSVAIEVVAETGSTNADLLARLDRLTSPTLLAAERQTAGRGRAGRVWHSAPGAALTFSLAWKFSGPLSALAGLPLAVGVALAEKLNSLQVECSLKWPNDILMQGKKLAGILIETASVRNGTWAVIGIGLNVALPAGLAAQIDRPAAALPAGQTDRDFLLAALLDGLSETLVQFEAAGFGAFAARWNRLHAHAGQSVAITDGGRVLHRGRAIGVDDTGRFLLDTASGRIAVMAGDVSLQTEG
jgi:BirA family biotin operon repressor/biotin-[acetyl-CoA-carboxylase] ligase